MVKYIGNSQYGHDQLPVLGILVTNLGTPDAPTPVAVSRYLAEFLSDPRVIEVPRPFWWIILHGFILRTRPRKSARAYQKIWTEAGSPLLVIAKKQKSAIEKTLQARIQAPIQIELAMRYGNPSIKTALEKLRRANVRRLIVLPLYPQYSATTTASTFDAVSALLKTWRWLPEMRFINHYHDNPDYIRALCDSVRNHWTINGKATKLLFSYHGIPKKYFEKGDPYFCECHKTSRLVAESLGLGNEEWSVSFQSRFGPREWLQPYTDETLKQFARDGIRNVSIICPGFSADCLETLEEINTLNRAIFLTAGGEVFTYIPALNDQDDHIRALSDLVIQHCQGWPELSSDWDNSKQQFELEERRQRSKKLGANS